MPSRKAPHAQISVEYFVVMLLILLAVFFQSGLKYLELATAGKALEQVLQQQETALNRAKRIRSQLEAIADETATLAEQGNANAIRIRAQLKEQGIDIRPKEN